jgi:hypothetical protein
MSEELATDSIETTTETQDLSQEESQLLEEASKEMTQEEWEEFNLKVNGKEIKEKVNLRDKDRITKALQMEKAAQQAFQERAITSKQLQEIEEEVQEFLSQFTTDPLSVLMSPDFNFSKEQKRQIAEAILREDLEDSKKTPEQLALEETKKKYEELLAEKQQIEEQRRQEEQARLQQEAAVELEREIIDAIQVGNLPNSTFMTKALADLAYIAYLNGVDVSVQDLVPFVKEAYRKEVEGLLKVLSDEEVETMVSKDRIRNIRNKQIQSVKPKNGVVKPALNTVDTGTSSRKEETAQKMKAKDFFNSLRG